MLGQFLGALKKEQKVNKQPYFWEYGSPAIVAYTGKTSFRCLRLLDRKFRHCLAIVPVPPFWVVVDSLANRLSLSVMDSRGLGEFMVTLHRYGYRCQVTRTKSLPKRRLSLLPCTCVETVKRALGILDPFVLTPKQLYNRIKENNLKTKSCNLP